jgi:hypothetical protein
MFSRVMMENITLEKILIMLRNQELKVLLRAKVVR